MYLAFVLDAIDVERITMILKANEIRPFAFSRIIAHHITYRFPVKKDVEFSHEIFLAKPTGYLIDNDLQVEAITFSVNGTEIRPDGKIFHCTLSLGENAKPAQSNDAIMKAIQQNSIVSLNNSSNFLLQLTLEK